MDCLALITAGPHPAQSAQKLLNDHHGRNCWATWSAGCSILQMRGWFGCLLFRTPTLWLTVPEQKAEVVCAAGLGAKGPAQRWKWTRRRAESAAAASMAAGGATMRAPYRDPWTTWRRTTTAACMSPPIPGLPASPPPQRFHFIRAEKAARNRCCDCLGVRER